MNMNIFQWWSLKTRVTLFTLAIFMVSIWSLSLFASRALRIDMEHLLGEQQLSTASILAAEINQDLDDRLRMLEKVAEEITPARLGNAAALQARLEQLPILQMQFNAGIYITGIDGTAIASIPSSLKRIGVNYIDRDYIVGVLKQGKSTIGHPVVGKKLQAPIFGMAVPIRDTQGKVIGALSGVINLGKANFLDRVSGNHYGKTGGYLLVSPQQRLIITATNKSRIMQQLPAAGVNPVNDRFIQGFTGSVVYVNPLDVEVLGSVMHIPVAGWYVLASLPTSEAFAAVHLMLHRMLLATILLTLLAAGLTWWVLSRQLSPILATVKTLINLANSDQPPQPLPITSQDEIGKLISAFNHLLETLVHREEALKNSESHLRTIIDNEPECIKIVDAQGYLIQMNPAGLAMIEAETLEQMDGIPMRSIIAPEYRTAFDELHLQVLAGNSVQMEFEIIGLKGGRRWVETHAVPMQNNGEKVHLAITRDITNRKQAAEKIQYLAFYDLVTQLPNRSLLLDRLKHALTSSARSSQNGAVLFLDLDHFKNLNDTLGHDIGDLLLQQVAQRLTSCVREGDTVARLGGDEFVVLLEHLSEQTMDAAAQAEVIVHKILTSLNQPYQLAAHAYHSTSSIGVALFNNHEQSQEDLLKYAEIAMYQAKQAGRNTMRFFDPLMQASISARAELEDELRKALDQQQLHLYYQIQVDNTGHALGAEALIRWIHPERGLVSPFHFIPLAEETGLILPIGQWVLETACVQLKLWQQDALTRGLTLSVNVSAKQFRQANFVSQVQAAVQRHAIDPMLLKLELTESMLVDNIEDIITKMEALKEIGIRFSLDDFGTGYSSLQYLKRLPLDQLKIDQSFVRDITADSNDIAIVRTIITMAYSLNLGVIAEGVETEDQRQLLLDKGCTHYQGYLFGKPVPIEQFEALLKQGDYFIEADSKLE